VASAGRIFSGKPQGNLLRRVMALFSGEKKGSLGKERILRQIHFMFKAVTFAILLWD
jgi:hypothetical protein